MESTKSYYLYELQERYSGQDWMSVIPKTYSIDGNGTMPRVLKSDNEEVCDNTDYSKEYLTIESLEDDNIICWYGGESGFTRTISASTDNGETWTAYTSTSGGTEMATLNTGDKVFIKGLNDIYYPEVYYSSTYGGAGGCRFRPTKRHIVYGNIMSLVDGDNFSGSTSMASRSFRYLFYSDRMLISAENLILPATTLSDYCYEGLFTSCLRLTTAPILPATTLTDYCYHSMFEQCTSLTTAPELPATTLAAYCYLSMFWVCTSLTTVPELPATTLAEGCYQDMFDGCTSIATAPQLPATTLSDYCYRGMFYNCASLTTAPALPAITLANWCYENMFVGCTSLTTAPVLSATTLADRCYMAMFSGCTSLTTAPELPANSLKYACYGGMFEGCTSLTTAPVLSAATLSLACYGSMFSGCTSLNSITCLATNISATNCTINWLNGVSASGTFTKASSMNDWSTGYSGIPDGWTVLNV